MSINSKDFKNQYSVDLSKSKAIEDFYNSCNIPNIEHVRQFMYQFMAFFGLELETKFPDFVSFDDDHFMLFGREKSKKSIEDKKKENIKKFIDLFDKSLENGSNLPTEVRPIFDMFAFKLVCPGVQDLSTIIDIVILDILNDIKKNHPDLESHILELISSLDSNRDSILDYIDDNFADSYPGLKARIQNIEVEEQNCRDIQDFIDDNSLVDIRSLTYSEYNSRILDCFTKMIHLSYTESYEEYTKILEMAMEEKDDFSYLEKAGKSMEYISQEDADLYSKNFNDTFDKLFKKKTNRLDLAIGDLMAFDVLCTSDALKKIGASVSQDSSRIKHMRNSVGYVSEFYSFDFDTPEDTPEDTPKNISKYAELQLQGLYRYIYGESGPAAHKNMPSGNKKRTFIDQPESGSEFENWARLQFMSLPQYFKYLGHGLIQVFSTLENFERYYNTEDPEKVKDYVKYIIEHDISLLNGKILSYSLDGSFILLSEDKKEKTKNDEKSR